MIKIGIHGASGRMGKAIKECLESSDLAKFHYGFDRDLGTLEELFESEVIIDFSLNDGTKELLKFALNHPKPIVIGTTGLDDESKSLMEECSKKIPIFYATNMSLGVAVLNSLVGIASKALRDFDAEILEMHHKFKKDAPSGTAFTLAKSVAKARNLDLQSVRVSGRDGDIGERKKDEIAVMSLRGGDIVGRHTVGFYSDGEFIELNHTATSRNTFANGAIKAAIWLKDKPSKLYSINEMLGL